MEERRLHLQPRQEVRDDITAEVLSKCLAEAAIDIDRDEDHLALAPTESDYIFAEKTKLLYAYIIGKLNTDLQDRILSIEGKNVFEVYRQIAQTIDVVPVNVSFVMNAELLQLATLHGPKVRGF